MKGLRILSILFFVCTLASSAQEIIRLRSDEGVRTIGNKLTYFRDSTHTLAFEQVLQLNADGRFTRSKEDVLNFNMTEDAIWVHLFFTTEESNHWYLRSVNPSVGSIAFHMRVNGGQWKVDSIGVQHLFEKRELRTYQLMHNLPVSAGDTLEVFLRVSDVAPLLIYLKSGTLKQFFESDQVSNRLHGIFIGIVVMMILYNAFLFLTNRNPVYWYYVGYMFFNAIFITILIGYVNLFPQPMIDFIVHGNTLIPTLFGIFGAFFTTSFLNTKKHAPVWHKIILSLLILPVIGTIVSYAGWPRTGFGFLQISGLLFSFATLFVGILVWRRGYSPAKYYVLGFGSYFIGLSVVIVVEILRIPIHEESIAALEIGACVEAIMLSFAIGDKLNSSQKEKQIAQAAALEAARENELIIREQNVVLETKVKERTKEIELQKDIIEEKNKDIVSSIHYAKRIQSALLASDKTLKDGLGEYFVFYKPKDIVSGDFYWAETTNEGKTLLCVGDCTGHGVPGAFMSLLNISFLNEALTEIPDGDPAKMLDHVRKHVILALATDEEGGKDGMDAVLIRLDRKNNTMQMACANNPVWIVRNGTVKEIKPDKAPVGKHHTENVPFRVREEKLERGDLVFLLTDGFADQFGGEREGKAGGKKFKYKNVMELLRSNAQNPVYEQKAILESTFETWKGNLEQIDDVLIIGIRY